MDIHFNMEELSEEALDQILGGKRSARPSSLGGGAAFGLNVCCNLN